MYVYELLVLKYTPYYLESYIEVPGSNDQFSKNNQNDVCFVLQIADLYYDSGACILKKLYYKIHT